MPLQPHTLRCEYLADPLGIDVTRPRLSWLLEAAPGLRAQRQTAYRILAATDAAKLQPGYADLWDSGQITSDQTSQIEYAGKPLGSRQRVLWAVQVWDNNGVASDFSDVASFEMGLLERENWQAQWISFAQTPAAEARQDGVDLPPNPYFRKELKIIKTIAQARLYITARGVYEAYLNGQHVSDALFAPGWTDYRKRLQYQTYDVTDLLQSGENVIGACLGAGWYAGYIGFATLMGQGKTHGHYGETPELLAQLNIDYTDGTTEIVATDASWRANTGGLVYSDMLMGEYYDARRELSGWSEPGFAAEGWQPVTIGAWDITGKLVADLAEPVRVTQKLAPKSINRLDDGRYIFDIGQNLAGWVRLKVQGAAGTVIKLRFAETLNPDGTLYTANLRTAKQTDTYILRGGAPEIYEPHFTFHGFRYVEISGYPGEPNLGTLIACAIHSDMPNAGTFECSHSLVNQLYSNIVWGQRSNFLSVPNDCPQRDERMGWTGDAQVFARTATYNMNVAAFFSKWLTDVADAQSSEGGFSDVAPRLVMPTDGAPAWGDAGVIIPWTLWRVYGDVRLIERLYPHMSAWLTYIADANPDGLRTNRLNNNFGDWLALDKPRPPDDDFAKTPPESLSEYLSPNSATPKELLATAYWAYTCRLMSEMADALGYREDAANYRAQLERIKAAFIKAYVQPDGRILGDTQTCYVLALYMDLLPEELRPVAAKHLVENIEARGGHLATGFIGIGYLAPVLSAAGYNDIAYRLLTNETFPSWGYSIKNGATTLWERWDGWTTERGFQNPTMNSFNHYSFGSIGQWLYQYVAGIEFDQSQPGFRRVVICPYPNPLLSWARATYNSAAGVISSAWRLENGQFSLNITIPPNVTATVYLPTTDVPQVQESDKSYNSAPGVVFREQRGDRTIFEVGSGDYSFTCPI